MRKYLAPSLLVVMALVLPWIGTLFVYGDKQGIVHEPGFYTVPLAELVMLGAIIWFVLLWWKDWRKKRRSKAAHHNK